MLLPFKMSVNRALRGLLGTLLVLFVSSFVLLGLANPANAANPNTPSKYDNVTADGSVNPTDIEFFCEFKSSAAVFCWRNAIINESNDLKEGEKTYWFDPELSKTAGHDVFRPDDGAKTSEYGWLHFPNSAAGDYSLVIVSTLPIAESQDIAKGIGVADDDVGGQSNHNKDPGDSDDDNPICNIEMFAKGDKAISCDVGDDPIRSVSNITYKSGFDSYVEVKKCDKGGLGFVLCPIQDGLKDVITQLAEWVGNILDINTSGFLNDDLRNAAQQILNVANAIYAIIFLVVIFANGLSIGIDNYTLKKMVPRLVAAIILSQFSFWLTGAFIEFGNVLGRVIVQFFAGLTGVVAGQQGGPALMASATAGLAAVSVVVLLMICLFLIVIIAILAVLAVLAIRWAALYVLILVAPLAFAAHVLPNTEKLWKLWWTNLLKLVMMYPIIMAIIMGSVFVGEVMKQDGNPTVIQIVGALLPFIGFLMVPKAFKWSGSLMAATGGKLNSWAAGKAKESAKDGNLARAKGKALQKTGGLVATKVPVLGGRVGGAMIKSGAGATAAAKSKDKDYFKNFSDEDLGKYLAATKGKGRLGEVAKGDLDRRISEKAKDQREYLSRTGTVDTEGAKKLAKLQAFKFGEAGVDADETREGTYFDPSRGTVTATVKLDPTTKDVQLTGSVIDASGATVVGAPGVVTTLPKAGTVTPGSGVKHSTYDASKRSSFL